MNEAYDTAFSLGYSDCNDRLTLDDNPYCAEDYGNEAECRDLASAWESGWYAAETERDHSAYYRVRGDEL